MARAARRSCTVSSADHRMFKLTAGDSLTETIDREPIDLTNLGGVDKMIDA
jgi:hypothetical protein